MFDCCVLLFLMVSFGTSRSQAYFKFVTRLHSIFREFKGISESCAPPLPDVSFECTNKIVITLAAKGGPKGVHKMRNASDSKD
jgi:hypothetical protein